MNPDFRQLMAGEWKPLSWTFRGDAEQWVKMVWPELYVRQGYLDTDPRYVRGARTSAHTIGLRWNSSDLTAAIDVDGELSPYLEPGALQMYMLVQWPELFKVIHDGQQT